MERLTSACGESTDQLLPRAALKGDAAEMKRAVEVSGGRETHAAEAAAAAAAALRLAVAGRSDERDDQQPQDEAGARHPLSLRQGPSLWSL